MTTTGDDAAHVSVLAARHEVELARAELDVRLRDVGRAGSRVWARVGRRARPFLIGGALVVGALILMRVVRAASRPRRSGEWRSPAEPSLMRMAIRSALGVVLRSAMAALVRRAAERLEERGPNLLGPHIFDGVSTPTERNDS